MAPAASTRSASPRTSSRRCSSRGRSRASRSAWDREPSSAARSWTPSGASRPSPTVSPTTTTWETSRSGRDTGSSSRAASSNTSCSALDPSRDLIDHQLRWNRGMRSARPGGYTGLVLDPGRRRGPPAPRDRRRRRRSGARVRDARGTPRRRVVRRRRLPWRPAGRTRPLARSAARSLRFAMWIGGFFGSSVVWRGIRYRLERRGMLARGSAVRPPNPPSSASRPPDSPAARRLRRFERIASPGGTDSPRRARHPHRPGPARPEPDRDRLGLPPRFWPSAGGAPVSDASRGALLLPDPAAVSARDDDANARGRGGGEHAQSRPG